MKRLVLLVCCILLVTLPSFAQVSFGIQGNALNFNTEGVANDIYGLGLGGGIHLDLGTPIIGLRFQGDYIFLSPDKNKYTAYATSLLGATLASGASIDGGKMEIWTANANAKLVLLPLPVIHIYATGGIGVASVSFNEATINIPAVGVSRKLTEEEVSKLLGVDKQTKMTTNVGAGLDIALGGVTLYGELKLNWIWTEPHTSAQIPIGTVGLTF
jgi:opacity protein-like surface antigen